MTKGYGTISPQLIPRHINHVKGEIELEKVKLARNLELDLEGCYTNQVIYQAEKHYRNIANSQNRMGVLLNLLEELESKALPSSLEGEKQKAISNMEIHIIALEKQMEILDLRKAPADVMEHVQKRLMEARIDLQKVVEDSLNKEG